MGGRTGFQLTTPTLLFRFFLLLETAILIVEVEIGG